MNRMKKWARMPFWDRVDWSEDAAKCWEWLGAVQSAGYGFTSRGLAHRIAYEDVIGPIPKGLTVDHLCKNKICCNPHHMEPVTRGENARRGEVNRMTRAGGRPDLVARTHCRRGHEFSPENTRMEGKARRCKTCAKQNMDAFKRRKMKERSA